MNMRSVRNSHRIARHAGQKGACPLVSGQVEDEKLTTDLPSQPTLEVNLNENLSQQGPSRTENPASNVVNKHQTEMDKRELYGSHVLLL